MLKGLGDIGAIMKMQKDMKNAQKNIKKARIEAASPDGQVKAVATGEFRLDTISISQELAASGDAKRIEKSVTAAVNAAIEGVHEFSKTEMQKLTGGMNLPGMMDFFK
jgi:hypothetical protein